MRIALAVVVVSLALMAVPAFAEENLHAGIVNTQRGHYTTPNPALTDLLNNNDQFYHTHPLYLEDRRTEIGGGIDLILYRGGDLLSQVTMENRYDVQNEVYSGYLVAEVDVFSAVKRMFE